MPIAADNGTARGYFIVLSLLWGIYVDKTLVMDHGDIGACFAAHHKIYVLKSKHLRQANIKPTHKTPSCRNLSPTPYAAVGSVLCIAGAVVICLYPREGS